MKKNIVSLVILLGTLLLLCLYFLPLFQGYSLQQSDTTGWKGMVQETRAFQKKTGEHTYWTGNLFSGMPTITFGASKSSNWFSYPMKALEWIPSPILMLFISFCGFFLLLRIFGVNHWLSAIGGLAYVLSSYFFIIIAVGHNTKMQAISFVAFVLAGILLTYRKKYLLGGGIFALALSLHIRANHPQITYYLLIMVIVYGICQLVMSIRAKELVPFAKGSVVLVFGAMLALGSNSESLYKLYDYSKVSTRGEQIIKENKAKNDGSDLAYATEWSYGRDETLSLLLPNIKGGASNGRILDKESKTYEALEQMRVKQPEATIKGVPLYWGQQLFTEGGVYVGALVFFLFLLGLFTIKGKLRWWIVSVTVLSILLAWGRNFMGLYRLFYDFVPMFSKFRNPSMILVLVEFTMPLFAFVALDRWIKGDVSSLQMQKKLYWSAGITIGICFLFILFPSLAGDFSSRNDANYPEILKQALISDRRSLLRSDALRSLLIVLLGALSLWIYSKKKYRLDYLYIILGILVLVDMWGVDRRFLDKDNFKPSEHVEELMPYKADIEILKDKTLSYRVLDLTENPFNSSRASYFHKSIGGYNAAKLRRYQDIVSHCLQGELQDLVEGLRAQKDIDDVMNTLPTLRMLNMKYLIFNPQLSPIQTTCGLGNAWMVSKIKSVNKPIEEIQAIKKVDISNTVVLAESEMPSGLSVYNVSEEDFIEMSKYSPNQLIYNASSKNGGVAVFSEIFHPDWIARIDGTIVPIIRANYTLMALQMPKGKHKISFEFKPQRYKIWYFVGIVSSLLLYIVLAILLLRFAKTKLNNRKLIK